MKKISINNGLTYLLPCDLTDEEIMRHWDAIETFMDEDIMKAVDAEAEAWSWEGAEDLYPSEAEDNRRYLEAYLARADHDLAIG